MTTYEDGPRERRALALAAIAATTLPPRKSLVAGDLDAQAGYAVHEAMRLFDLCYKMLPPSGEGETIVIGNIGDPASAEEPPYNAVQGIASEDLTGTSEARPDANDTAKWEAERTKSLTEAKGILRLLVNGDSEDTSKCRAHKYARMVWRQARFLEHLHGLDPSEGSELLSYKPDFHEIDSLVRQPGFWP